jgi:hypothetical protein
MSLHQGFADSNPDEADGFLGEIKNHSTLSFGGGSKAKGPHFVRFNGILKNSMKYERDIS